LTQGGWRAKRKPLDSSGFLCQRQAVVSKRAGFSFYELGLEVQLRNRVGDDLDLSGNPSLTPRTLCEGVADETEDF